MRQLVREEGEPSGRPFKGSRFGDKFRGWVSAAKRRDHSRDVLEELLR